MVLESSYGIIAAICSSAFMASQRITSRRGMVGEKALSPSTGVFITQIVALLFFGILTLLLDLNSLYTIDQITLISLGLAGIIHFVIGRTFSYHAYKYLGVNGASPFIAMNSSYAVIFGVLLLNERLSILSALGASLIVAGVIIVTVFKPRLSEKDPIDPKNFKKGILLALGAGLSFGSSAPLIRLGLTNKGSPISGPLISYIFALLFYLPLIFFSKKIEINKINFREAKYFFISGILVNTAHLARYFAFAFTPISIATPLLSLGEVFSPLFTRFLIKKYELFNKSIIIGIVLSITGSILTSLASIGF